MLAGEQFSDHPASVSPVIASFMRSYNDRGGEERRAGLYAYVARVVGTRDDSLTERRRAQLCMSWARRHFDPPPLRVRVLYRLLRWQAQDLAGVYAARAAVAANDRDAAHRLALGLIDKLLAIGGSTTDFSLDLARGEGSSPVASRLSPAGEAQEADSRQSGDDEHQRAAALHE